MSEHADLDHAQSLLARAERAEGEVVRLREERDAARAAGALQVAREWQEVLTILAADTAATLDLDIQIELKEKRGHPYWWGKVALLRTLKDMADADVARFSVLAPGADLVAASQTLLDAVKKTS